MKLDNPIIDRVFKMIYGDNGNIVSVYKEHVKKSEVFSEALYQAKAEELGYSVPKILDILKVDDKWAVVTEGLKGEDVYEIMKNQPERIDECLERIVDAQIDMHNIECEDIRSMSEMIDDSICATDLSAVGRFYLHRYLAGLPRKKVLCHGDLNPKNLFLTEDGKYFVVDWKYTASGDPDCDAMVTYLELILQFNQDVADKYLAKYVEKTGANREDVEKWIPVCAAFIMARHQFGNDSELERFIENY